jgi:hypothetical protein
LALEAGTANVAPGQISASRAKSAIQKAAKKIAAGADWLTTSLIIELSKVRREEPGDSVAQLDNVRSSVHVVKREGTGLPHPFSHCVQEPLAEFPAIALDIELEVKSQTARIPICRSKERPGLIDNHELGVIKLAGT